MDMQCTPPHVIVVGQWVPGRYAASVRVECGHVCIKVGQSQHEHFLFTSDATGKSMNEAIDSARNGLAAHHIVNPISVNDWRYTDESRDIVEMKLDAPGTTRLGQTCTFGAENLARFRTTYWIPEMDQLGGVRARRITNEECMESTICRSYEPHGFNTHTAIRDNPYMHQAVAHNTGVAMIHRDGDMLNNTTNNVVAMYAASSSSSSSSSSNPSSAHTSDDDCWSTSPQPSRHQRGKYATRTNLHPRNHTGIPGLSQSSDGTRYHAKFMGPTGEQRKSFGVKGCQRSLTMGTMATDEQKMEVEVARANAYKAAAEFIAMNANIPTH